MSTPSPAPLTEHANNLIVLRSPRSRKAAYVRAAHRAGQTLAVWMFAVCDEKAGYAATK